MKKPDFAENGACHKKQLCQIKTLACENFDQSLEADFRNVNKFDAKYFEKRHDPIFEKQRFGKLPPLKMPNFIEHENFAKNQNPDL